MNASNNLQGNEQLLDQNEDVGTRIQNGTGWETTNQIQGFLEDFAGDHRYHRAPGTGQHQQMELSLVINRARISSSDMQMSILKLKQYLQQ